MRSKCLVAAVLCIFLMLAACNKVDDGEAAEEFEIFRELVGEKMPVLPVSSATGQGIEELRAALFDILRVIRVYSKAPGHKADLVEPFVLPVGSTVKEFAEAVHRELAEQFKFARIWSLGKYEGQMVNREELLHDGDILELHR